MRASTISAMTIGVRPRRSSAWCSASTCSPCRSGGKLWFYWIAPLLAIGFFAVMAQLAVMYWVKVGRLETKGRPRK